MENKPHKKNPAAVALGRLGGKAGKGASKRRSPEFYAAFVKLGLAARRANMEKRKQESTGK